MLAERLRKTIDAMMGGMRSVRVAKGPAISARCLVLACTRLAVMRGSIIRGSSVRMLTISKDVQKMELEMHVSLTFQGWGREHWKTVTDSEAMAQRARTTAKVVRKVLRDLLGASL